MTWEPGTVAVATVRGVPGVRVMRTRDADVAWVSVTAAPYGHIQTHTNEHVTDVRPLVVLDLNDPRAVVAQLRSHYAHQDEVPYYTEMVADQIEAQTRQPKPPEPKARGAVVRDRRDMQWTRVHPGGKAWVNGYETWREWAEIDAVEVLSEGVAP